MSLTAIVISLGVAAMVSLYAGIHVKLDEVPKGRMLEKFALYFMGITLVPICTWFAYVVANNTSGLEYLTSMLLVVFMISLVITLVIAYSYVVYMIEKMFDFSQKDDAEVDD